MLRSRSLPPRGLARPISDEEDDSEEPSRPARPVTSIYPEGPLSLTKLSLGPAEKLLGKLQGRKFCAVEEFERLLPGGEWVLAMGELLSRRYAFDRVGLYFRIRNRKDDEPMQLLVDLLDGIDLPSRRGRLESTSVPDVSLDDFDPETDVLADGGEEKIVESLLVLSDPPEDLALPVLSTATSTGAILAKKRSGKTYLAMVLVEEVMSSPQGIPVVIVDPLGQWYGMLAMADGSPSPFHILVLGGHFADLPIRSKDGRKAAQAVNACRPGHSLLDLSDMTPVEQHEFMADFVQEFHSTAPRLPVLVVVDEADEFAPQRYVPDSPHQKRSLDGMDRLVRRGRARGIGTLLITQRCAVINKNLLTQVEGLWILNMVAPNDLAAVSSWLLRRVTPERREECLGKIPTLLPGTAFFLQGGERPMFRLFKVRRKRTFDSSSTPTGTATKMLRSRPSSESVLMAKTIFAAKSVTNAHEEESE